MKVVICALNSQYIHSSLAPWYLLAGIKKHCGENIDACVAEGSVNENIQALLSKIVDKHPDVVGFSCYIWNITTVRKLAAMLKEEIPAVRIILGGPEVSYNQAEVLNENAAVDFVLSGEGEYSFAALINAIEKGGGFSKIPGISCVTDAGVLVSPEYTPDSDPPSPYSAEYFAALGGRISYIETSRGCPFSCAYCLSGRCGRARFFDLNRCKSDILSLAASGTKTIKFVDRTFNANRARAEEIIAFIIDNCGGEIPAGVCFHFEIAGDILADSTIDLLGTAPRGAIQLEIGIQSFNCETLSKIRRKTDLVRLKRNVARLISFNNMHIHIDLIAGLPLEDMESFRQSFNTAFSFRPNMLQLGFLKLLHGAPMREESDEYPCKYSKTPPYEVISTPWISKDEMLHLHRIEQMLDRLYNSGRFDETIRYCIKALEIAPFDFFKALCEADFYAKAENTPLDKFTCFVYDFLCKLDPVDPDILRDKMIIDRLSVNSSGVIPAALKRDDPALSRLKARLRGEAEEQGRRGVRLSAAILYTERRAVYAEYDKKDPVTGKYALKETEIPEL